MRAIFKTVSNYIATIAPQMKHNMFGSSDLTQNQPIDDPTFFTSLQISTMRGLFIVLLVGYHIVGSDQSNGLNIADGRFRMVTDMFDFLRMPLIATIGGIVYGLKPIRMSDNPGVFFKKKIYRLLIPMFVVGTLFAVIQRVVPGVSRAPVDFATLYIFPVAHYWFLESLFWIFITIWILEKARLLLTPIMFCIVMAVVILAHLTLHLPYHFGLSGWLYLLPYFLFGLSIVRFKPLRILYKHPILITTFFLFVIAEIAINGTPQNYAPRNTLLFLSVGISLVCITFWIAPKIPGHFFALIGESAFTIYLYHIFFTASMRILLKKAGIQPWDFRWLHFLSALAAAIIGSLIIELVMRKSRWTSLLFLGEYIDRPVRKNPH